MNTIMAQRAINHSVDGGGIAALVKQAKMLPRAELIRLTVAAQQGDEEAMRRVIDGCSRLVLKITSSVWMQWASQIPESASFDDIYQAGLEGLYVAIMKFDASTGNTLTTVATLWIKTRAQRTLYTTLGIGRLPERALMIGEAQNGAMMAKDAVSLESSLIEDGESFVHRLMGAEDDPGVGAEDILSVLGSVDARLPLIAQLIAQGYSDAEVGEMFDITHERIRQLRGKGGKALTAAGLV